MSIQPEENCTVVTTATEEDDGTDPDQFEVSTSTKNERLPLWNTIAFVLNVLVTYGIGTLGWFGTPTNAELSEKYQVGMIVPR